MKKRNWHSAEHTVKTLRDADTTLAAAKSVGEALLSLEISESKLSRWRTWGCGMKSEEAKHT